MSRWFTPRAIASSNAVAASSGVHVAKAAPPRMATLLWWPVRPSRRVWSMCASCRLRRRQAPCRGDQVHDLCESLREVEMGEPLDAVSVSHRDVVAPPVGVEVGQAGVPTPAVGFEDQAPVVDHDVLASGTRLPP